jgi:two-component system, HptB-dependent secretion and biofilm response regulator
MISTDAAPVREQDCQQEIKLLKKELAYVNAMMDTQQTFMVMLNSSFQVEKINLAFKNFVLNGDDKSLKFELPMLLKPYQNNKLPTKNIDLVKQLENQDDLKASFELAHSSIVTETFVFSIRLSKTTINDDRKYIISLNDITIYEKAKAQEIELFKFKERYNDTQQKNAFQKQLKIIKDEASHTYHNNWFFDSFYKPLDILSGDVYGTVRIKKDLYFFYIVDAMGKGLSASVTSIQSSSFINNALYLSAAKGDFSLDGLITSFTAYIRRQLLDDEMLCATFMLLDTEANKISYANYAMPPIVIVDKDGGFVHLDTNNPPIMSYFNTQNISTASASNIQKMIIFSDGLNENMTKSAKLYQSYLEEDFSQSDSLRSFLEKIHQKTSEFEDDLTIIYIANCNFEDAPDFEYVCKSKNFEIALALQELDGYIDMVEINAKEKSGLLLAINEIISNALEHGNLGITGIDKDRMLKDDTYDKHIETLETDGLLSQKTITIKSFRGKNNCHCSHFMKILVEDEGAGFDVEEAFKILHIEDTAAFRGRGIPMSMEFTDGLFYDDRGTKAIMLKAIQQTTNQGE